MKITIDTQTDSANDIHEIIVMLQNVLKSRGHHVKTHISSFASHTKEDRLAKKIAKAKEVNQYRSTQNTVEESRPQQETFNSMMGMFSEPKQENSESEVNKNSMTESSEKEIDEDPKIEFITY